MSDINFVETDAKTIYEKIINDFEAAYGETLYPADERRIFLQQLLPIIIGLKNDINDSARQNLLRYARGKVLDAIAEDFFDTKRLQAQKANCYGQVTLTEIQNNDISIPSGKRVTPDGNLYFCVKNTTIVPAGKDSAEVVLEATEVGAKYNNFLAGQIKNIVDPIPFVESIVNTDTSKDGADIEDDESLRDRARNSFRSLSTAGPEGAYEYWAKSADSSIVDVKTISPSPGVVRIISLLKGGEIPSQLILDKISNICSSRDIRPLTDKLETATPTIKNYDINITYYLDIEHKEEEKTYRTSIEGENLDCSSGAIRDYINWQQERLGKPITPDELRYRIQSAATYTSDDKKYTAVRRIVLENPIYTVIGNTEVAKAQSITVNYGGIE